MNSGKGGGQPRRHIPLNYKKSQFKKSVSKNTNKETKGV
jgi:hypothetical protein